MKQIITAKDVEELLKSGGTRADIPAGALLTPSAEDMLRELPAKNGSSPSSLSPRADCVSSVPSPTPPPSPAAVPAAGPPWTNPTGDLEAFFNTPENQNRKEQICDVGRRLWAREYVDGNGGNISIRVGRDVVLCTPTLVSKGFMRPEQMCLVDLEGNQLAGTSRRTSEILMHLEIMKTQPRAVACVHCHPPYATAFAASGVKPPNNILPEFEVFIGEVPIAGYHTPGTKEMGQKVAALSGDHNTILMANHGVVAWSHESVEDAYFKMEILEAYCRTIMVTTQLGRMPNRFTGPQMKALMDIKQTLGVPDPRIGREAVELDMDDAQWRPGVTCVASAPAPDCGCETPKARDRDPAAEEAVQQITDMIMKSL